MAILSLLALLVAILGALLVVAAIWMTRMPGRSHGSDLPPLSAEEAVLEERISTHVRVLAGEIGERSVYHPEGLQSARDYLARTLRDLGYDVRLQEFPVGGLTVANLEAVRPGTDPGSGILVVGAHYDTAPGTPGANDNASGVAVVLELARLLRGVSSPGEIRFVFFVNEELPFFGTEDMGSLRYAREARERKDPIRAMISVETVGYYSEEPGSQKYPFPLQVAYPNTGNFIAFVGNLGSRSLARRAVTVFRRNGRLPSEGGALPGSLPGIGWSDQWAFWETGYPAIMVTDTALFRDPNYHRPGDLPSTVDGARTARLAAGLVPVVLALAGRDSI
jgi:hypothetical protein